MVTTTLSESYVGLSTDEKPTHNIRNGSIFIEMDTKKCYFFDAESNEWLGEASSGNEEQAELIDE